MTTEYSNETVNGPPPAALPRSDNERDKFIASHSTSGYFLSYGVAMALSQLIAYLERDLRSRVTVVGDKGHSQPSNGKSLIVLGSPANNRFLPKLLDHLAPEFPLLGHFRWAVDPEGVSLKLPSGERLVSDVDDHETGTDFALVVSVTQRRGSKRRLVLVSGCGMWGTEAAARFLIDRESLRSMPRRYRGNPHAMVFIIKAWISRGRPDRVELFSSPGWPIVMDPRTLKNVPHSVSVL